MEIKIFNQNYNNEVIEHFQDTMNDSELKFLASEMLKDGFNNMEEINDAINRAIQICRTASIPLRSNFKSIYLSNNGEVICDWKLSSLSRKLVIINAAASLPFVAQIQIELLKMGND